MENMKVAIIGAGPSGCMLARLLHLGGVKPTIFERDADANYRTQGGTLDLHTKTGLAAVKEAGLWDEFLQHARYDGQYMAIVDKNLKYYIVRGADVDPNNAMGERPEIDRTKLREILLASLPEGTVKWNHSLQQVKDNTLIFADGTTASGFDLIVGADGGWSRIRNAIAPELQPVYTRVGMHDVSIPDAQNTAPEVYKLANRGSIFASADGIRLTIQQMGDGSLYVTLGFVREDSDWMKPEKCNYNVGNIDETKDALVKELSGWCPQLHDPIKLAQGKPLTRSLFRLPIGQKWQHKAGFTLIGDAAHLMTPHAGEGVNQALEDAMLLSRVILRATNADELDRQIADFEDAMISRVEKVQQLAYDRCEEWMFTPGAPEALVDSFMRRRQKMARNLTPEQEVALKEAMEKAKADARAKNQE